MFLKGRDLRIVRRITLIDSIRLAKNRNHCCKLSSEPSDIMEDGESRDRLSGWVSVTLLHLIRLQHIWANKESEEYYPLGSDAM
jgi:hypothetical protein